MKTHHFILSGLLIVTLSFQFKENSKRTKNLNNQYESNYDLIDTSKTVKIKTEKSTDTVKTDSTLIINDSTKIHSVNDKSNAVSFQFNAATNDPSNKGVGSGYATTTNESQKDVRKDVKRTNESKNSDIIVTSYSAPLIQKEASNTSSKSVELKKEIAVTKHFEKDKSQYDAKKINPNSNTNNTNSNINAISDIKSGAKDDKNKQANSQEVKAGLMTGGETNDLSKWNLWNDMVKTALEEQKKLWKIYPYNRYTVLLQTKDNMPVQGAKVALITNKGTKIWEAITDNTGTAQLWKNIYGNSVDTVVTEIQIDYKNIKESIKKPVDFFHGINTKTLKTKYEKPEIVDIVFMVDATASMKDEINFLKEEMNDIIQKTQKKYDNIELHLGSLFYRCKGNEYETRYKSLTKNHSEIIEFISQQNAAQGGVESVEVALEHGIDKLNWHDNARTRLLFLVLDEPPGYQDSIILKMQKQIQLAAKKGIKIIPVVASGGAGLKDQRNMEYLMRSAALATNGNYIFITNHSGIGNNHIEPIIDNYNVEFINDIITRTIENNIFMPDPTDENTETEILEVDNKNDIVNNYLDSLYAVYGEIEFLEYILPFTDYSTIEELKENLPINKIDTTKFLSSIKKDVHTLKIYPNPSNGYLKAEYNTNVDWLYISDLSGKILQRLSGNAKKITEIDLTTFPNGLYIVQYLDKNQITGKENKWISAKIVLQK